MSVDVVELDLSSPNVIPDEVIPNLNMLRLEVLHRVERNLDGTFIVTPKRHFVTNDSNPLKFASSIRVVHNNYRLLHTPLRWTRETHNFAS